MKFLVEGDGKMNENQLITSFVVRCSLIDIQDETGKKQWRIKVSHVQGEKEIAVQNLDEALRYMKRIIGE